MIVALCGSSSSWIENNILSSTGFLSRISIDLVLEELPLKVCNAFWRPKEKLTISYQKFKVLPVTGGGLLVREFDEIFSNLFSSAKAGYKKIVLCLASGPKEPT